VNQLFRRKPIAELVPETDNLHGLRRALGAGDLILLSIGAVIGAGIFSSIGTAAAGQVLPDGTVVRYGAGPALIVSFILLGAVCAFAALCYAELAAMIGEEGFDDLDAPVMRLGTLDAPIPFSPAVQQAMLPGVEAIVGAVTTLLERNI
jgi:amino acid permease